MIGRWFRMATGLGVACAIALWIPSAEAAKAKRKATSVRDAHAQQYPNWERVTSAPRGRECIGTCSRYNLPPGGGQNYMEDNLMKYGGPP